MFYIVHLMLNKYITFYLLQRDENRLELDFENRIRFSRCYLPKPVMNIKIQSIGFFYF